jgi:3-deoxy-D-manno-octulosonic-acid transferase
MTRALLPVFSGFTARSEAGARALRRLGVRDGAISIVGALREGARMLPYNETDRETLAALLRGRPTWLAAAIQPEELPEVLRAYRRVNRLAHRSLLVIVPDDPARGPDFRDALAAGGWRHVVWSEGQMPEETTQILLADTAGELGLWYAVAAITFMGSSLVAGHQGRDPNAPAAHGSAILYGPNVRRHLDTYRRYAEAGAARQVRDAADLAATVQELLPPDRSAAMAHAAWDVASEAAGVTDHIIEMVQESLDEAETP